MPTDTNHHSDASGANFATTHWSVVFTARDGDSSAAVVALERLCHSYWRPVYAYIRRDGRQPADAQDLTQEFFLHFIEKEWIDHLQHQRGKFRSFLLTFLKHFLSDERDRAGAQKRGGGQTFISIDELQAEENYALEPSESLTADQVFERRWAQTLMERAVARLRQEYVDDGKAELFQQLKDLQPGERGARSYMEIGAQFGLSEAAVKSAVHRLRARHRDVLRSEIARTLGSAEEVDEEIRHLIRALGT
jgi:RNA polymerase sigma-70 factor (ECF subfamily)